MKRRTPRPKSKPRPRAVGTVTAKPTPGWKAKNDLRHGWRNPRTPSVPATLELSLDEYYTAASLLGLISSQAEEPNQDWCRDWSFSMGSKMATEARKRRRRTR